MAISKRLRFKILTRDRFTCRYCGRSAPSVVLHVDHVHPVSRGGTDDEANLVTACVDCNASKAATILPFVARPKPADRTEEETFPHPDRCGACFGRTLYAAHDEAPTDRGFVAFYRCRMGHTWKTHWSNHPANRLTKTELLEVAS